jgi:hypothetical protein
MGIGEIVLGAIGIYLAGWMVWFVHHEKGRQAEREQQKIMNEEYIARDQRYRSCPTAHRNAGYVLKRYDPPYSEYGRSYIERSAHNDIRHGINLQHRRWENCWGLVVWYCPDCDTEIPVTCAHGGSMWLCPDCFSAIASSIERKEQESLLMEKEVIGR